MRAQNKGRKCSPGWVLQAGPPALHNLASASWQHGLQTVRHERTCWGFGVAEFAGWTVRLPFLQFSWSLELFEAFKWSLGLPTVALDSSLKYWRNEFENSRKFEDSEERSVMFHWARHPVSRETDPKSAANALSKAKTS